MDVFAFVGGFFQRLLIFLRFAYIIEKEKTVPVGQSSAERSADMKRKLKTPKSTAMPSEQAAVIPEKPKKDLLLGVLLAAAAVLFFAMLALCGVYLNMRTGNRTSTLPPVPASDRWILTGSGSNLQSGAKALLSPSFIGIKAADGTMTAATFDTASRKNLQKELEAVLDPLLSGEIRTDEITREADKRAFAADLCRAERYLFCSFFGELPAASLVPAIRAGDFPELEQNFFVRYLFLLPDEDENLYAVCLDDAYNAVFLYPRDQTPYTADQLSAYTGVRGYAAFSFVNGLPESAVYTESFDVDSVVVMPSSAFYTYDVNDEKTKALLKTLGLNIKTVKSIRSGNNAAIDFVDGACELYVSLSDGSFVFSSAEDGLMLSDFLGYYPTDGKNYTFADQILCVKYLLGTFDRILVGGDASPTLVGISLDDDGTAVFRLKYFYNGVMLTENAADIVVHIRNNRLVRLSAVTLFCDGGSLTKPVLPQTFVLPLFENAENRSCSYHAMFENDSETNQVRLVWVAEEKEDIWN